MKKKFYFKPRVCTGRMAAYNLVLAIEIEVIYGNIGEVNTMDLYKAVEQLKNWLLLDFG